MGFDTLGGGAKGHSPVLAHQRLVVSAFRVRSRRSVTGAVACVSAAKASKSSMRRGTRKLALPTSLLALAVANPVRSLLLTSVGSSKSPLQLPRGHTTASAMAPAAKRRARPAWIGQNRRPVPSIATCFSGLQGTGGRSASHVLQVTTKSTSVASAAGNRPPLKPLTHEQLPEESIYILDGTSMLFRAFYGRGAGGYLASNGVTEVGAVLAMGIEFAQFINEVKPRYVAMAFDVKRETTFRRELYPEYKAHRKPVPVDLNHQIPLAKALSEALGCRTFSMEGYEADDVMATLARWGRSAGLGVVVCSSDKDMCQLVRDRVHVMQPRSDGYTVLGDEEVMSKFGVKPSALPDLFGLVGDVADNIPGVKGIGPKGGSRLLEKFGTLEGIFAGLEGVGSMQVRGSKSLQALLSQPGVEEEAMLYREIATLDDEVPLEGYDALTSSTFLYKGAAPEAEGVMSALGFHAPLRMIQEGSTRPAARGAF